MCVGGAAPRRRHESRSKVCNRLSVLGESLVADKASHRRLRIGCRPARTAALAATGSEESEDAAETNTSGIAENGR